MLERIGQAVTFSDTPALDDQPGTYHGKPPASDLGLYRIDRVEPFAGRANDWIDAGALDRPIKLSGALVDLAVSRADDLTASDRAWMQAESDAAPDVPRVPLNASAADVAAGMQQLEAVIVERLSYYDRRIAELPDGRLKDYYLELKGAMERDLIQVRESATLTTSERAFLQNRLVKEVNIEIRYNVELSDTAAQWNAFELTHIESALAKLHALSPKFTLENPNLTRIFRVSELDQRHGQERGLHGGPYILLSAKDDWFKQEGGVNLLERTMIEQVVAQLALDPARRAQFNDLSGWKDLGDQNAFPKLSTGDLSTAMALGINDPDPTRLYVISKRDGRTFAHPEDPAVRFVRDDAGTLATQFPKPAFDDGCMTPEDDFIQSVSELILRPGSGRLAPEKKAFIEQLIKDLNA